MDEVFEIIKRIRGEKHIPVILVEQNAYMALAASQRAYVLELGHVVQSGESAMLMESDDVKKSYLGG